MRLSKTQFVDIAEILKSIAHPKRIKILLFLDKSGTNSTVTQVHENLGLTQSETSRHLSILKRCGVLSCKKEGANSYYFINKDLTLIKDLIINLNKINRH